MQLDHSMKFALSDRILLIALSWVTLVQVGISGCSCAAALVAEWYTVSLISAYRHFHSIETVLYSLSLPWICSLYEESMKRHISKTAAACFYNLRRLRQIRRRVGTEITICLAQALVISRLDYCNASFAGLPTSSLRPFQRVQNAAAGLIFDLRKTDHVTQLHWLPYTGAFSTNSAWWCTIYTPTSTWIFDEISLIGLSYSNTCTTLRQHYKLYYAASGYQVRRKSVLLRRSRGMEYSAGKKASTQDILVAPSLQRWM